MTKQGGQRRKIIPDHPLTAVCVASASFKPGQPPKLSSVLSESFHQIPAFIKNVCPAFKIRTAGLDAIAPTNQKAGTSITLRRIRQFPVDSQPKQWKLVGVEQAVVTQWFDDSGITIGGMANILEK